MSLVKKAVLPLVGVAALLLFGAASAQAQQWDPLDTPLAGSQVGSGTLTSGSASVTCQDGSITVEASSSNPSVATGTPTFSHCTSSIGFSANVSTSGPWEFEAVAVDEVDVSNASAIITIGGGLCTITVSSVSVAGNDWDNSSSELTSNSSASFPISRSGFCPGTDSTATIATTWEVPGAQIN